MAPSSMTWRYPHCSRFPKWAMVFISISRCLETDCNDSDISSRSSNWDLECKKSLSITENFQTFRLNIESRIWKTHTVGGLNSDYLIVESRLKPHGESNFQKWMASSSFAAVSFGKSYATKWRSQLDTIRHSKFFCFLAKVSPNPAPPIGVLASLGIAPGDIEFVVRMKSGNATSFGNSVTRSLNPHRQWFELFEIDGDAATSGEVNLKVHVDLTSKDGKVFDHEAARQANYNVMVFPFESNACVTRFLPPGIWSSDNSEEYACLPSGDIILCLEQHEAGHIDVMQMTVSSKITIPISSVSRPALTKGRWMVLLKPSPSMTLNVSRNLRPLVKMEFVSAPSDRWRLWKVVLIIFFGPPCALILFFFALMASSKHSHNLRRSFAVGARRISPESSLSFGSGGIAFCQFARKRMHENFISGSYSSLILLVSTAFFIAAFQLALSGWKNTQINGSRDTCRYNYECFDAEFFDIPINNILSHLPYVVCGFVALIMLLRVDYEMSLHMASAVLNFHVFYALAICMIMEGVGSTAYHICPRTLSFQFDVAMMYVIAVLSALGLADADVWAEDVIDAPILFSSLVLPMWSACIMGTWFDAGLLPSHSRWIYKGAVLVWCIFLLVKANVLFQKAEKKASLLSSIGLLSLRILGGIVVVCCIFLPDDWSVATGKVILLVAVAVVFLMVGYQIARRTRGDWISVRTCRLFLIRSSFLVTCLGAYIFFVRTPYKAGSEPWMSHNKNQPCSLFGTFDNHDVWHVLSAIALALWIFVLLELRMGDYLFRIEDTPLSSLEPLGSVSNSGVEMPSRSFGDT